MTTTSTATKATATLSNALAAREARMGTEINDARNAGHALSATGSTVSCTCGYTATVAPRAAKVMMGIHAREAIGSLSIATVR